MNKCCSLLETLSPLQSAGIFLMKSWWEIQIAIKNQYLRGQTLQGTMLAQCCCISYCPSWAALLESEPQALGNPAYQGLGTTRQEWEKPYRDHLAAALVPGWNPACLHTYKGRSAPTDLVPREPLLLVNGGTLHCLSCTTHTSTEKQPRGRVSSVTDGPWQQLWPWSLNCSKHARPCLWMPCGPHWEETRL